MNHAFTPLTFSIGALLLGGVCIQEPTYGAAIYSDGQPGREIIAAQNQNANNLAFNIIDGASARPRPRSLIKPYESHSRSSLLQNKTLAYDFGGDLYIQSSEHFKCCSDNISIIFLVL